MDSKESYIYGLLLADGNIYFSNSKNRRVDNRGRVSLEVNSKDKDIVLKLFHEIPNSHIGSRIRNTNFKQNYHTYIFSNGQKSFRDWLISCGFPTQNKTVIATPPTTHYEEKDFWRGVLDGDGSLGFLKRDGIPFVSLITVSESLKDAYCSFLNKSYGIEKRISRNKRDNAYNINVYSEQAVILARDLYDGASIYLDRKYSKSQQLQQWTRPLGVKRFGYKRKTWTHEEDNFILTHSIEESIALLQRTKSSIKTRLWRLNKH